MGVALLMAHRAGAEGSRELASSVYWLTLTWMSVDQRPLTSPTDRRGARLLRARRGDAMRGPDKARKEHVYFSRKEPLYMHMHMHMPCACACACYWCLTC